VICDTDYASFRPERRVVGVDEVVRQVQELLRPGDDLVITGGEPMLFPHFVAKLCDVFAQDHFLTIETNGTKPLTIVSDTLMYSVSPKLASSQSGSCLDQVAQHVREAGAAIQLKFVCAHPKDLDDIDPWVRSLQRPASVYLMPLGSDEPSIAASATWVAEAALERGYSYSDRLHVRLWGGRRGV
jgi:organic radical activating enzyme